MFTRGPISIWFNTKQEMVTLLEEFANSERQLLVIAEDVKVKECSIPHLSVRHMLSCSPNLYHTTQGDALDALVMNKERGALKVAAMKVPGFGVFRNDYYTDISIATGATFLAKEVSLKRWEGCRTVIILIQSIVILYAYMTDWAWS